MYLYAASIFLYSIWNYILIKRWLKCYKYFELSIMFVNITFTSIFARSCIQDGILENKHLEPLKLISLSMLIIRYSVLGFIGLFIILVILNILIVHIHNSLSGRTLIQIRNNQNVF